jgi:hypothetical protein
MWWSNEQRAFAVEAYFSNGGSVVSTQRAFRKRFNIAPLGPVPEEFFFARRSFFFATT